MINKPTNIQTGRLFDEDGKNYDITVVLNFPTQAELDNPDSTDEEVTVNMVDFYFGDTNDSDTAWYVDQFVQKQTKLQNLLTKLYSLKALCPDDTEINEHIEFVKSLIVKIH